MTTTFRTRRTTKIAAGFFALATVFGVTACTNNSEDNDSSDASGSSSSTFDLSKVEKDNDIAAKLPDSIKNKGTLNVGHDGTYAPAEFMAGDGRTLQGYDIEITDAVAKVLGLKANHLNSSFDQIIPSVGSKYDMAASSFTVTPERQQQVNMITYFEAGTSYAVAKGNAKGIKVGELCGKTVSVQTGTTQQDELNKMNESCKDKINILSYAAQTDVATAVAGGKADVMLADSPVAAYAVKQSSDKLEILGDPQDSAEEAIVVAKDQNEFAEAVRAAVQKLIDDGTMKEILSKWGTESGMIERSAINPAS